MPQTKATIEELRTRMAGKTHYLARDEYHGDWLGTRPPRLTIASGDTVVIETRDASNGKVRNRVSNDAFAKIPAELQALVEEGAERYKNDERTQGHALNGPIAIESAEDGDVLQIDILEIKPADWGWSSISPGFGLLAEEFDLTYVQFWDMRSGIDAPLSEGIRVPLEPHLGVMGVAPRTSEPMSTIPPRCVGGNLDIKQLTKGATLYLPIHVPGALFSTGDAHGAMGDGEVCGCGIEMESVSTLRFTLRKDMSLSWPRFETSGPLPGSWNTKGHIGTTGIGPDLFKATQDAIREMIAFLIANNDITREEAYVLCSVAVDLKISEVVDEPNWLVSAFLPKGLFVG
jgi:acetamidase/formamidase